MPEEKPWWYPEPITDETVRRLRDDYPDETDGYDDETVLDLYELSGYRYEWSWDHVGEAKEQADKLADEILRQDALLKRAMAIITDAIMHGMPVTEEVAAVRNEIVCGKSPSDPVS